MSEKEQKRLMKIKKRRKQNRPLFHQYEAWRYKKIKEKWRKPKGIDNHMRQNRKGWPKSVNVGWGTPKAVRHLHPSGKEEIMVNNTGDLTLIDPEYQVGRISGQIGGRKRVQIVEEAKRLNVKLLNPVFELPDEEIFEEEDEE
jgi:large subunit ribosomal protein L32e